MASFGRAVLWALALFGAIGWFVPALWDKDSWKRWAGIEMPTYSQIILSPITESVINIIAIILIIAALNYFFLRPVRRRLGALETRSAAASASLSIPSTITFRDCHFHGTAQIPLPEDQHSVTGGAISGGQVAFERDRSQT
jgi:hypothetical protein